MKVQYIKTLHSSTLQPYGHSYQLLRTSIEDVTVTQETEEKSPLQSSNPSPLEAGLL